jgi:hypothetical protein
MRNTPLGCVLAVIFGVGMILGGCAATINYSYDHTADFSTGKNYNWVTGGTTNHQASIIEKNIRYYADQSLKEKGFILTSEKPDFMVSMHYQEEYSSPYKVLTIDIYIYRAEDKELIWQGTARGNIGFVYESNINTDATSSDLAAAVNKILKNFPPAR